MLRLRSIACLVAVALLAAACGGDGGDSPPAAEASPSEDQFNTPFTKAEVYPIFVSSEIVVGQNRFLLGLLDEEDAPVGSPDIKVSLDFYHLATSDSEPRFSADAEFIWLIKPVRGLYVTNVRFDEPGKWGAAVTVDGEGIQSTVNSSFQVKKEGTSPAIGERPPASDTPTIGDVDDLSEISSDPHPEPSFYQVSIKEAMRSGKPFVVVFATPKFCTSEVCGPTLDVAKAVAEDFPDVTWIHVEVYTNLDDPSALKLVPSVEEWGLPSEPWVFVVDGKGRVAAKFEGSAGEQELRETLRGL